jgi:hypothetical protein
MGFAAGLLGTSNNVGEPAAREELSKLPEKFRKFLKIPERVSLLAGLPASRARRFGRVLGKG